MFRFTVGLVLATLLFGCHPKSALLEPQIVYIPQERHIKELPTAFPQMTREELFFEWARELQMGEKFARELDLYRAITCFKRAQFLLPPGSPRRLQVDYDILEAYYLGGKYYDAIALFEGGPLSEVDQKFPALPDMLLMLYDAYGQTEQCERQDYILQIIEKCSPDTAANLQEGAAILIGDECLVPDFACRKLSVQKAQTLNALLPGAGYYYVGQKKAALTSFVINTLFTAAAVHFFNHGNVGAGAIVASLELGWYAGGINGAGLAAKEHNQAVYNAMGKETMIQRGLFPVLMFDTSF